MGAGSSFYNALLIRATYYVDELTNFVWWNTKEKREFRVSEMPTEYIIKCFRYIWNEKAPKEMRFGRKVDFKYKPPLWLMSERYRKVAVLAFAFELSKRRLTEEQLNQLDQIRQLIIKTHGQFLIDERSHADTCRSQPSH